MTTQLDQIKICLETLLPREDCVLTFDQSLIDELGDILRENFGVTSASEADRLPSLKGLLKLLLPEREDEWDIAALPKLLDTTGIDRSAYAPRAPASVMRENEKTFSH